MCNQEFFSTACLQRSVLPSVDSCLLVCPSDDRAYEHMSKHYGIPKSRASIIPLFVTLLDEPDQHGLTLGLHSWVKAIDDYMNYKFSSLLLNKEKSYLGAEKAGVHLLEVFGRPDWQTAVKGVSRLLLELALVLALQWHTLDETIERQRPIRTGADASSHPEMT